MRPAVNQVRALKDWGWRRKGRGRDPKGGDTEAPRGGRLSNDWGGILGLGWAQRKCAIPGLGSRLDSFWWLGPYVCSHCCPSCHAHSVIQSSWEPCGKLSYSLFHRGQWLVQFCRVRKWWFWDSHSGLFTAKSYVTFFRLASKPSLSESPGIKVKFLG